MATWFTSDLHFGHVNIIKYTNRPFASVHEMNESIVATWNSTVAPDDDVWVLGDVCMGRLDQSLEYVARLNGTLTLAVGNHDKPFLQNPDADPRVEWEDRYRAAGFSTIIHGQTEFDLGGAVGIVDVCHFPYTGDHHHEDRYSNLRPVDNGRVLLHGHTHGRWRQKGRLIDVGIDAWGGQLVDVATLRACAERCEDRDPLAWVA